jgi:hypothetical protein
VVHHVQYDGRHNYTAPAVESVAQHTALPITLCNCVELHVVDALLHVVFGGHYSMASQPGTLFGYRCLGAPGRTIPHEPFALFSGCWGQIRYFGRFNLGHDGYIVYKKYSFNIAWQVKPDHHMFLATQPQQRFASLPRLW